MTRRTTSEFWELYSFRSGRTYVSSTLGSGVYLFWPRFVDSVVIIMIVLPQQVECNHCGYTSSHEATRLRVVGASGAWVCPACNLCNTTYHLNTGFRTELGYHRHLEVGFF